MMNENPQDMREILKTLSPQDFLNVGMHQIAYIKPHEEEGGIYYSVHAADGTELSVVDTYASAFASVQSNDMQPITLQ